MPTFLRLSARLWLVLNLILVPLTPGQLAFAESAAPAESMNAAMEGSVHAGHGCTHTAHADQPVSIAPCCCDGPYNMPQDDGCCGGQCGGHCANTGHGNGHSLAMLPRFDIGIDLSTQTRPTFIPTSFPEALTAPAFRPPIS